MPSWGEVLQLIQEEAATNGGQVNVDEMRRKYLTRVHEISGHSVIHYTTDFLGPGSGNQTAISLTDMQGLMEVFRDLPGPRLDLILHSPGGQAEATDSLVRYLRTKFTYIRVFVPLAAMSAATMWAMACDEIVMGKHSQLGPIDPQITLPSGIPVPAKALIDQFDEASEVLAQHPERMAAWLPTLQQYPPGLLNICQSAGELACRLVGDWLQIYMLKDDEQKEIKANAIADWLSDDKAHLSHGRALTRDQLRDKGLVVTDLESNEDLQDAVLSAHHAAMHTFQGSAVKIMENHLGRLWVQHGGQQIVIPSQVMPQPQPPVPAGQN